MTSWCLDVQESGYSACLLSSSDLTIEGSEIISNMKCSPFIVSDDLDGCGCQIQIIRSTHKSTSNVVLPLVGTSQDPHEFDIATEMMNKRPADHDSPQYLSISGVDLVMTNQHFPLGTGPLLTFQSHHAFDRCKHVETSLLTSTLVNVSSSSAFSPSKQLFGSDINQRVVGNCVAQSTNHDSGTGMMSPNLGGNLMCLNTSFSSCIRQRNTDLDISFENRTQTHIGRLTDVAFEVTSVSFTLCTFNEMTVAAGPSQVGAAIFLDETNSSLTITTCFFHNCTCTGDGGDGGAISFESTIFERPFSLSDSSFTECSAKRSAGSINVGFALSIVMDNCFFEQSTADTEGAASLHANFVTITNTAFVECSSNSRGGALTFFLIFTLSLSFSQFRGCSSTSLPDGRDMNFFYNVSTDYTSEMIQFCDSTSGAPNVYFSDDSKADSTLVPQIDPLTIPTITSLDVTFDGDEATVSVEATKSVKGTMAVLLDGSNVPRLVHVVFGDIRRTSNLGAAVVSSGANGILPSAAYTNRTSTLAPFPPPTVRTADASLKDLNMTEIVLKGVRLLEGSYWMLVEKGGHEWNITLTHSDVTTLIGTAPLHPSTAKGRLEWSTEYEVTKVMWTDLDGLTAEEETLSNTITFTTPILPSLTDLSAHIVKSDQRFAFILLHFNREVRGSYDFVVEERGNDVTFTVVVTSPATTRPTQSSQSFQLQKANRYQF
ncbi:hypothetical protein BLNAU_12169 [Blattamonas nauphoetae]|uniref:Uncharacterized protein n=1 Tax=Blattamonas nauphoetae TaxID=2049346 RepID=A0ABQ9XND5_9EUKA|nr:hypothetical protein BLNAU_12169 [Blattamonas nauphoetae]